MEYVFCDEKANLKSFHTKGFVSKENYGYVYNIDDGKCLKVFNYQLAIDDIMLIKKMMEIELYNFPKIYEMLYGFDGNFKACVIDYYEKVIGMDILLMPTEYTIANFLSLCDSVCKLADNSIFVGNLNNKNVVSNKNDIMVVEPNLSLYEQDKLLEIKNKEKVYELFIDLYVNAIKKYHASRYLQFDKRTIYGLFYPNNNEEEICKKLRRVKYPFDYIVRGRNR